MDSTINFVTTIAVSNFPATQPVSGTVAVSGTVTTAGTATVSGSVAVSSLPATPAGSNVIGHVIVDTAPTTAVTIAALPALTTGAATIGKADQGAGGASAWKVDGSAVTQPVSGTVAISGSVATTGTTTATLAAGSAVIGHVVVDSAPTTAVTLATAPALVASSAVIGHVIVDTAPTTAVTIASLPALTTGAATIGKVDQGAAGAAAWKVDGSAVTQPVSIATAPALVASSAVIGHVIADSGSTTAVTALPAIPTGSNTIGAVTGPAAAALALEGGHLAAIDTSTAKIPAQGQALAAASMPVVLPAIQVASMATSAAQTTAQTSLTSIVAQLPTALAANGGIKVEGVAGGVAIPTSSALGSTAANQVTAQTSLTSIDGKAPALGQALAASSVPVVLTAIQIAQLAQETTQATGNTSLATLVTNSPALVSGRVPVAIVPPVTADFATLAAAGFAWKVGAGIFYSWHLYNATGNSGFMMLFDLASAGSLVSGTTKPRIQSTTVVNNVPGNINIVSPGMAFTNGLVMAFSSTSGVYTVMTLNSPTLCNGHLTTSV